MLATVDARAEEVAAPAAVAPTAIAPLAVAPLAIAAPTPPPPVDIILASQVAAPDPTATDAAAASPPPQRQHHRTHAKGDPLEGLNRKLFAFHQRVDHLFFRPIALLYKHVIPKPLRTAMRHILANLGEPLVFMNDVLQLKPKRAAQTLSRFVINSAVGVGGIFDVAKTADLPHHDNSLGDTFARYGIGPGPYLFVPFLGPTDLRDLFGGQVENVLYPLVIGDPFDRVDYQISAGLIAGLDLRAESDADFKALLDGAADPYATLRSVYLQSRAAEIAEIKGKRPATELDDPLTDPLNDPLKDPGAMPADAAPTGDTSPAADTPPAADPAETPAPVQGEPSDPKAPDPAPTPQRELMLHAL